MQTPVTLRTKLILSYVGVALGTIVILIVSVAFAVQQYFIQYQYDGLQGEVQYRIQQIYKNYYIEHNNSFAGLASILGPDRFFTYMVDKNGSTVFCSNSPSTQWSRPQPGPGPHPTYGDCTEPTVIQSMTKALHGQTGYGSYQSTWTQGHMHDDINGPPPKLSPVTLLYAYQPIVDTTHNNQIIGAVFLAEVQPLSPLSGGELIDEVDQTILITAITVALVVFLFSLVLAHHFTQPLKLLTRAAEQMKKGKYTQRVTEPKTLDELGQLALTFNEMANTIETDVNELRRQDQMRRDLVANIAHDLATPLTSIQGFSEALADDVVSDPATRQETAQRIAREVQRLRRLVADIQQMSSLEAGTAHLDLAPLDLHSLVDETLFVIEPECKQADITVSNNIPPTAPLVLADSDRIAQVLLNLLDNARRHTPSGGKISVGALPQRNHLFVWVIDTGSGIDQAALPHIFERFYRADRARSGNTGGSGLGLSIVKAIISAHRGAIWAESAPGVGTRITFTLPIAVQATPPATEAENEITAPRKRLTDSSANRTR